MSTSRHPNRPWYCPDDRVANYRDLLSCGGDPTVIQALKVIRTVMLNAFVVALAWWSISQGGDPTFVPTGAFATLAVVNGFEYSDWAAFRQAVAEANQGPPDREED